MRITVDLPDATFRRLKALAARRGTTLKQVLRSAIEKEIVVVTAKPERCRISVPVLKSKQPGALKLTNAELDDFLA